MCVFMVSLCLCVYVCLCLSVYLYVQIFVSVCLGECVCLCLCVCLSVSGCVTGVQGLWKPEVLYPLELELQAVASRPYGAGNQTGFLCEQWVL